MIYFFYGDNTKEKNKKKDEIISRLSRTDDLEIIEINSDFVSVNIVETYAKSIGLFSPKLCVVCNNIFLNNEVKEFVLDNADTLKDSPNFFIFLEDKLLKDEVSLLKKKSEDCILFEIKKEKKEIVGTNPFSLAETFGERDKKNSWVIYQKLINEDKSVEELAGILFWQVKTMLLVKLSPTLSASVLSMNPFTHKKAMYGAKNFKEDELKNIVKNLSLFLTQSRRANIESNIVLEQLILKSL